MNDLNLKPLQMKEQRIPIRGEVRIAGVRYYAKELQGKRNAVTVEYDMGHDSYVDVFNTKTGRKICKAHLVESTDYQIVLKSRLVARVVMHGGVSVNGCRYESGKLVTGHMTRVYVEYDANQPESIRVFDGGSNLICVANVVAHLVAVTDFQTRGHQNA